MKTIYKLTISAIKMFARNRQALFFTIFMPIILMSVFGLIGFDKVPKIDVGIALNAPPNEPTKQILAGLREVPAFEVHEGTEYDERKAIETGDRAVVFLMPYDLIPESPGSTPSNEKVLV